jgi:hypothetical protein
MALHSRTRYALHFTGESTLENLREGPLHVIQAGLELYVSRPRSKGEVEVPYLLTPAYMRNWFLLYLDQRVLAQTCV